MFFALTTGAKIYYLAGAYVYLLAAAALPIVLPVVPAADIGWTYPVNQELGESIGWPLLVSTVDGVWTSLPPRQRASAVIFAADYGEAGAINELGRGRACRPP